ncbi:hypothetical protein [Legionella waltersii]|uniref:Uncharacterized protein n=1 Tax=Legionella waltersii TaxID=66969 RepID=A0A0W1A2R8_9GAMM|nr:hypothetical protein [Legionella waltersii]KTD75299.1 hypothetical protein Lwal_3340 [Legionella waltersii]SNV07007.1 Uncharacterised protein [Legionella waltersii]
MATLIHISFILFHQQKNTFLDNSDFYLLMSTMEEWPNKLHEEVNCTNHSTLQNDRNTVMQRILSSKNIEEIMVALQRKPVAKIIKRSTGSSWGMAISESCG